MADFRKSLLLAAMALAVGVGTASAQCTGTTGVPPLLRSVGVTELTGLISITCPASVVPATVNFLVQENALDVTSLTGEPFLEVTPPGVVAGGTLYTGTVLTGPANTPNIVAFDGVVVPAGGFTIQIGGIRINAAPPSIATSSTNGIFTQATAQISITNGVVPILNPLFVVGYVVPNAITASVAQATVPGAQACTAAPSSVTLTSTIAGVVTIAESPLDADAFKIRYATPLGSVDSESGDGFSGNNSYQAVSGTQFAIGYVIPSGLTFYVPVTVNSINETIAGALPGTGGGFAALVTGPGSQLVVTPTAGLVYSDAPTAPLYPASGLFALTGSGTIYYNVEAANPSIIEDYQIPVFLSGSISTSETGVGIALAPQIAGELPQFTGVNGTVNLPTTSAAGVTPFADGFFPILGAGSQAPCQTTLLFPFVTNQAGFDTGFSIAYTGTDPFGTSAVTNGGATPSCTLYFYGNAAPTTAAPALSIGTGFSELHDTISGIAPGFQGYMMAVCNFVYAHGYAFITDGFMGPGRGLSEGYVANVVGDGQRAGTPSTPLTFGQPEILGH